MGAEVDPFVRDTYTLIEDLFDVRSLSELEARLSRHVARCGVEYIGMCRVPPPGQGLVAPLEFISRWPEGWTKHYDERRYLRHDPVMERLITSVTPFAWSDVPLQRHERPTGFRLMQEAGEAGLLEGFSIPIFDPSGAQGCITLAGRSLDLRPDVARALHMASLYVFGLAERLHAASQVPGREALSEREREVLRWISIGTSQGRVAEILGLSERTVEAHLRNARHKLGTTNTVHTTVVALQRREIRF